MELGVTFASPKHLRFRHMTLPNSICNLKHGAPISEQCKYLRVSARTQLSHFSPYHGILDKSLVPLPDVRDLLTHLREDSFTPRLDLGGDTMAKRMAEVELVVGIPTVDRPRGQYGPTNRSKDSN